MKNVAKEVKKTLNGLNEYTFYPVSNRNTRSMSNPVFYELNEDYDYLRLYISSEEDYLDDDYDFCEQTVEEFENATNLHLSEELENVYSFYEDDVTANDVRRLIKQCLPNWVETSFGNY